MSKIRHSVRNESKNIFSAQVPLGYAVRGFRVSFGALNVAFALFFCQFIIEFLNG